MKKEKDGFDKHAWRRQFFNEWYHGRETYEQYNARVKSQIRAARRGRIARALFGKKE